MTDNMQTMWFVLGSWLFWGTYPVPFKSPSVVKEDIDPFVFQFLKAACVCVTSVLILTWKPFYFTYWGFVGAALWIPAGLLFITSVKLTGVAFAAPITNGVQVIVSFCWGAFFFKETVHNPYLSVVAMLVMIVGMIGISIAVNYEKMQKAKQERLRLLTINVSDQSEVESEKLRLISPTQQEQQKQQQPTGKSKEFVRFLLGIVCAICSGFFGGTQNVPLKHAPEPAHGIQYIFAFGIGAVCVISTFSFIYVLVRLFILKIGLPIVKPRVSLIPGCIAGCLWSAGNVCQLYATLAYGTTVGFPLVMCNMMVAGLWGVFYYNEAKSILLKSLFIVSCLTLLGGVTLLSKYG